MSYLRGDRAHGGVTTYYHDHHSSHGRNGFNLKSRDIGGDAGVNRNRNCGYYSDWSGYIGQHDYLAKIIDQSCFNTGTSYAPSSGPSFKRRKFSADAWGNGGRCYQQQPDVREIIALSAYNFVAPPPARSNVDTCTSISGKRNRSELEDDELVFMSRDEIERHSPSRKDGIDVLRETHLRYSYCAFIQDLGMRLDLPQTTIGTAMVLCHRFFIRRSHACHDRFLIATAALFLAAKSEETPRPLNNVLRISCEIFHKQDMSFLSYMLPVDWFEQYRERVTEAEQIILTTLNFELNVQHPYDPLTSVLQKLGLSQSILVDLALKLVSEGLRSSLWLQFKAHHIAAGAAYLASKLLNMDLASYNNIWQEFETTPTIIQDVSQQLMELFS